MEALGEVDVVGVGARAAAQDLEIEPDEAAGALAVGDGAALDVERLLLLLDVAQLLEDLAQRLIGADVIDLHALHLQAPVVGAVVHRHHVEPLLEEVDRRQEALALQPVGIEPVGSVVRGHDELDAAVHHLLEEAPEDHGIRDVRDVELVEADQAMAARGARGDRGERVLRAAQLVELAMDLAHEVMEVHAALALEWHAAEERVHEEALAAADRAPEVDALRQLGMNQQALQRVRALRLVGAPLLVEPLQPLDRAPLRRIGDEAALGEALLVERDDILRHGTLAMRSCAERSSNERNMIGCSLVVSMAMRSSSIASQAMLPSWLSQICTKRRRSPICVSMMRKPKTPSRFFEFCTNPCRLSCAI